MREKTVFWNNQKLPSLSTFLKLVDEILDQFLLNPNVNADFLHQGSVSQTIV